MDQMPEAAQLLFYNTLCSNSREADSNNDDASLGATHPDDNIELGEDLLDFELGEDLGELPCTTSLFLVR